MKRVVSGDTPAEHVHSMVEFAARLHARPIKLLQHVFSRSNTAVTWPDRVPNTLPPLRFLEIVRLEFFTPRYEDFPALNLARRAGETGGTLPCRHERRKRSSGRWIFRPASAFSRHLADCSKKS